MVSATLICAALCPEVIEERRRCNMQHEASEERQPISDTFGAFNVGFSLMSI